MLVNIMMRYLLLFLMLSFTALAQERKSRPLPRFFDGPYASLSDSVKGWSYSMDGQWLSADRKIPVRGISRNTEFYERNENVLGIDNFTKLLAYEVEYGRDRMVCLVKLFRQGKYKYPTRKKGWDEFLVAYYMIVDYQDWKDLKNLEDETVHVERLRAYDGGKIHDVKEKELLDLIKGQVVIKPGYDRNLVVHLQYLRKKEKVRFQICSLHEIFPDVEGVRQNFTRKGRTVYGSTSLFDFLYYEADYLDFLSLLEMNSTNTGIEDNY